MYIPEVVGNCRQLRVRSSIKVELRTCSYDNLYTAAGWDGKKGREILDFGKFGKISNLLKVSKNFFMGKVLGDRRQIDMCLQDPREDFRGKFGHNVRKVFKYLSHGGHLVLSGDVRVRQGGKLFWKITMGQTEPLFMGLVEFTD